MLRPRAFGGIALPLAAAAVVLIAGCTVGEPAPTPSAGPVFAMDDVATRAAHTATTLLDGRVLIAGGCVTDGCAVASSSTALVDAEGTTAVAGPPLAQPRSSHTATPLPDGRVLIVGGFLGEGAGVTDVIEVFDPVTGKMQRVGSLTQPRGGHAAAPLLEGRVLVVGGWIAAGRYTDVVEIVDPATGATVTAPPLPWAADALEATTLPDGGILVTGGQTRRGAATANAAVFDPDVAEWRAVAPMSSPRFKHFAVLLDDGRVLIGGGTPDDRMLLDTTEIYDRVTERFTPGPTMNEGRYKLPGGVAALPQSRVLIASGGRTAEIVDVARGSSEQIASFGSRASFATVSLLAVDAVLVLGGYDDDIALTRLSRVLELPEHGSP